MPEKDSKFPPVSLVDKTDPFSYFCASYKPCVNDSKRLLHADILGLFQYKHSYLLVTSSGICYKIFIEGRSNPTLTVKVADQDIIPKSDVGPNILANNVPPTMRDLELVQYKGGTIVTIHLGKDLPSLTSKTRFEDLSCIHGVFSIRSLYTEFPKDFHDAIQAPLYVQFEIMSSHLHARLANPFFVPPCNHRGHVCPFSSPAHI